MALRRAKAQGKRDAADYVEGRGMANRPTKSARKAGSYTKGFGKEMERRGAPVPKLKDHVKAAKQEARQAKRGRR